MSGKHGRHRGSVGRHDTAVFADAGHEALPDVETPELPRSTRTATLDRPGPTASAAFESIVPGGGSGTRRAARLEKRQRRRKQLLIAVSVVCVVALITWAVASHGGGAKKHTTSSDVSTGRTQSTLLVQVKGDLGAAVDSALIAHDSAAKTGVVVLVPSTVISQVPGFGSMPFGQASTLGQANLPRMTLSDLMHVDVDGSWVLSTKGLQALVDKLGGVTVDVDKDVTRPGPNGTTTIVIPAGNQRLDGAGANAFATFLDDGESDDARLARFNEVFNAVLGKLPREPAQVASLLTGVGGGSTSSFSTSKLADLLAGLAADSAANSTFSTILPVKPLDTGDGPTAFSVDAAKTATLVSQQLAQSVPANHKTTGNRVMVENQVGTPGIGETTRQKLIDAGFVYIPGQNAPGMPNATAPSVVLIQGTTAAEIEKGNQVAKALGLPASDVKVSQQHVSVADVIVLVGADYKP